MSLYGYSGLEAMPCECRKQYMKYWQLKSLFVGKCF